MDIVGGVASACRSRQARIERVAKADDRGMYPVFQSRRYQDRDSTVAPNHVISRGYLWRPTPFAIRHSPSGSRIVVLKPNDIVFTEIGTQLHFNNFNRSIGLVFKSMHVAERDEYVFIG